MFRALLFIPYPQKSYLQIYFGNTTFSNLSQSKSIRPNFKTTDSRSAKQFNICHQKLDFLGPQERSSAFKRLTLLGKTTNCNKPAPLNNHFPQYYISQNTWYSDSHTIYMTSVIIIKLVFKQLRPSPAREVLGISISIRIHLCGTNFLLKLEHKLYPLLFIPIEKS